ncbi:hypothetical protein DSO57_1018068 [Entomophthora muscae]|uniref:Uncharacterized protein n=1 Tax=Entomophthora muscae TaxID=34485 RepID=A0ACC2S6D0_9FUNG|nr:hypothetical protein DSO57_1018068 [Entomophthora muscae]
MDDATHWDVHLPAALWSYRSKVHSALKFKPYEMLFGVTIWNLERNNINGDELTMSKICLEGQANVKRAAEAMRAKARLNPSPEQIPISSEVLVFKNSVAQSLSKKFLPKWSGPYKVVGYASNGNYCLVDVDDQPLDNVINCNHMKLFHCNN